MQLPTFFRAAGLGALALFAVVTATAVHAAADNRPVWHVSMQHKDQMDSWIASGVLKDAPYRIVWVLLATASDENAALLAGNTDAALAEGSVSVTLQQAGSTRSWADGGAPVTIIAAQTPREGADYKTMVTIVKADGPIKQPSDLRGHSITFKKGGNMYTQAVLTVKQAGIPFPDVKFVDLDPSQALVAFRTGQVDALANNPALLKSLTDSGKARVLYTNTDLGFPSSNAAVVRTGDLKDPAKAALFRDFVKRIQLWNDWKAAHIDAFTKIVMEDNHLTAEVAEYGAHAQIYDVDVVDASYFATEQRIADALYEAGGIPKKVDVRLQYDTRFNADIAAVRKLP